MNILKSIAKLLSGRKTYVVAILLVLLGVLQGEYQLIIEGIGLICLRLGIAKK